MKKIALLFTTLILTSCAAFLNEKIDAVENLSNCFHTRVNGVSLVSFPIDSDISLTTVTTETSITLEVPDDFTSYVWSIDGEVISGNENKISIAFDGLEGGWHLVTVIVCDKNSNYYSASIYFQVKAEKTPNSTGVTTSFEGTNTETLAVSYSTENDIISLTATSGFISYSWMLDGNVITGNGNTATVNLSSLTTGIHIVTVTAKNGTGIYYSATSQISKNELLEPDIKCTGITLTFDSETRNLFSVTSSINNTSATFTATSGFMSYSWTLDGTEFTGNGNTATVSLAQLSTGWHLITVTACTNDGVYYSATMQLQKTSVTGIASIQSGIIYIGFESSNDALSINNESDGNENTLTATIGFETYTWTVDGVVTGENSNTLLVAHSSLEPGWHLITVTAVKNGIYYSASTYIQKKGA